MTYCLTPMIALLLSLSIHAAEPPRVRVARSLSGSQVAGLVTNAPKNAKISVPLNSLRDWRSSAHYAPGDVASRAGSIFVCVQAHTSQADWIPSATPALWRLIRAPSDGAIPAWRQPLGAHDMYVKGAKVLHGGHVWTSTISGNVWAPGVYGWIRVP